MDSRIEAPIDLMLAPATLSGDSLTLVWDKPLLYENVTGYLVYQNGYPIAFRGPSQTHIAVAGLNENTDYEFRVEATYGSTDFKALGSSSKGGAVTLSIRTKVAGETIDVTQSPYFADATGQSLSTGALQKAIDDCPPGGTVLIPDEAVILTGAIDLKSNMTLQVDGTLMGSLNPYDYIISKEHETKYAGKVNKDGLILTRYEGWELFCYRSLINGGYLNPDNREEITCENIRICGKGSILGGGNELGDAMKKLYENKEKYPDYVSDGRGGRRIRGRLLGLIQCKNVHITGINIENPPCWTIHMIYCDSVTTHGVSIKSRGIDNGDGWDPDSSKNLMIFDTTFDTGDDCIAIKSGKNPEGNTINIPTKNVRIFDLKMLGGHGMAIGSEQSGGVDGVYIRDCVIKNTMFGLECKAHNYRGGYIKNLRMIDCEIDRFMAHSVSYNADGTPAPNLPYFKDIIIKNTLINGTGRAVELIGFTDGNHKNGKEHYVNTVLLENVILGKELDERKEIYLKACYDITFKNVKLWNGKEPEYIADKDCEYDIKM